jgi:uncharacterized membrane protein
MDQPEQVVLLPKVNRVRPGAVARWLRAGWQDLRATPGPSLFYGGVLAGMGLLLTRHFGGAVGLALSTGFLLMGPFLAIGLYELSRRHERGFARSFAGSLQAWRLNFSAICFYAVALTLMLAVWIRVSVVVVALFFPEGRIDWLAPESWIFVGAYAIAGSGLALFVFATTWVSLPLLLDRRELDTISAAIVSVGALRANFRAAVAWGATIVVLTAIGFATLSAGLVVVLPLIGHATWHAYREAGAAAT